MAKSIRIVLFAVVLVMLVLPTTAPAKKGHGKQHRNAVRLCKQLRAEMGAASFRSAYGAKHERKAFRRCVKRTSRTLKRTRGQAKYVAAIREAQAECREEFDADFETFEFDYDEPRSGDGGAPEGGFADCIDDYAGDFDSDEDLTEEPDEPELDQPGNDDSGAGGEAPDED